MARSRGTPTPSVGRLLGSSPSPKSLAQKAMTPAAVEGGPQVNLDPSQIGDPWVVNARTFAAQQAVILRGTGAGGLKTPENRALPTISGTAQEGQQLTVTPGSWWGEETTLTHQWYRDGVARAGQTGTTYTVVAGDVGHVMTVGETATSAAGTVEAISAPTATVIAA